MGGPWVRFDEREGEREGEWASERKGGTARARQRGFAQSTQRVIQSTLPAGKRVTIPGGAPATLPFHHWPRAHTYTQAHPHTNTHTHTHIYMSVPNMYTYIYICARASRRSSSHCAPYEPSTMPGSNHVLPSECTHERRLMKVASKSMSFAFLFFKRWIVFHTAARA